MTIRTLVRVETHRRSLADTRRRRYPARRGPRPRSRGRPRSSIAVEEPLGVEVTYDVLREGKNIQPALHFKSPTDQFLFVVAYTDPEWLRCPPAIGRHITTAWVPSNLLNIGITHVSVALNTPDPFETHCTVDRAVSFNVYERFGDDDTARGLYGRDFPGAVRPRLHWDTRRSVDGTLAMSGAAEGETDLEAERDRPTRPTVCPARHCFHTIGGRRRYARCVHRGRSKRTGAVTDDCRD